ncbi:NADH-quinone oxidoreductase subunit J [Kouleothrix sp.]|uniref:NADH-quinone oxidoreductase subunit J family protein n=1 Tax=Kouleothrix sp. TaxID=2779161 RepID=UPI00391D43EB
MNILILVIFFGLSAFTLAAGVMVVTVKNIIHAALWLIASFFSVAALYLLMEAEFIAIVQVLVYVGAISILVLFAIMLTRHVTGEGVRQLYQRWWVALIVAAALFGVLIVPTVFNFQWSVPTAPDQSAGLSSAVQIGTAFMREYLLPFEIASVLLLVALIGAIVIAFEERASRRRVLTLAEEVELRRQRGESLRLAATPTVPEAQNTGSAPSQP